jgi:hypothetical protein
MLMSVQLVVPEKACKTSKASSTTTDDSTPTSFPYNRTVIAGPWFVFRGICKAADVSKNSAQRSLVSGGSSNTINRNNGGSGGGSGGTTTTSPPATAKGSPSNGSASHPPPPPQQSAPPPPLSKASSVNSVFNLRRSPLPERVLAMLSPNSTANWQLSLLVVTGPQVTPAASSIAVPVGSTLPVQQPAFDPKDPMATDLRAFQFSSMPARGSSASPSLPSLSRSNSPASSSSVTRAHGSALASLGGVGGGGDAAGGAGRRASESGASGTSTTVDDIVLPVPQLTFPDLPTIISRRSLLCQIESDNLKSNGFSMWCFDFMVPLLDRPQRIRYMLRIGGVNCSGDALFFDVPPQNCVPNIAAMPMPPPVIALKPKQERDAIVDNIKSTWSHFATKSCATTTHLLHIDVWCLRPLRYGCFTTNGRRLTISCFGSLSAALGIKLLY